MEFPSGVEYRETSNLADSDQASYNLNDRGPRFVNHYVRWRGLPSRFAHFICLGRDSIEGWGSKANGGTVEVKSIVSCPGDNGIPLVQHVPA